MSLSDAFDHLLDMPGCENASAAVISDDSPVDVIDAGMV